MRVYYPVAPYAFRPCYNERIEESVKSNNHHIVKLNSDNRVIKLAVSEISDYFVIPIPFRELPHSSGNLWHYIIIDEAGFNIYDSKDHDISPEDRLYGYREPEQAMICSVDAINNNGNGNYVFFHEYIKNNPTSYILLYQS